jgi:hypothetical protein
VKFLAIYDVPSEAFNEFNTLCVKYHHQAGAELHAPLWGHVPAQIFLKIFIYLYANTTQHAQSFKCATCILDKLITAIYKSR